MRVPTYDIPQVAPTAEVVSNYRAPNIQDIGAQQTGMSLEGFKQYLQSQAVETVHG